MSALEPLLKYATSSPETLGYRMKLASHAILSAAAATENDRFPTFSFLSGKEETIQRIDALTGLSPELLSIIQSCNNLAFQSSNRKGIAIYLLNRLNNLEQVCIDTQGNSYTQAEQLLKERAIGDTTKIAECYRLATILYIHYRILGNLPSDHNLKIIQNHLVTLLEQLPPNGQYFKATWPLWPLFIYSVQLHSEGEKDRIKKTWTKLEKNSIRSNICPVVEAIQTISEGRYGSNGGFWWEECTASCGRLSLT
ncbi:hypothetical protein M501DRAFT_806980 [Patellaria atrata CBS 101060]|uniref:Uncharacterized protein n=1 Tax=Patellaria atrata CBS 101060 TaxID=1346257 RepID=A0A9P4SB12_9PEZI|nr:hypothetical protein M501DRAFT_806980 [Patellaria atrata CBS 101060]